MPWRKIIMEKDEMTCDKFGCNEKGYVFSSDGKVLCKHHWYLKLKREGG